MRIALVTETFLPRVDGIVRMLLEMLDYLRRHGHEAIVFAPGRGISEYQGTEIVRVAGLPVPLYPGMVLSPYSRMMRARMRQWQPDLVHLAGPFVLGAHALSVARSLGIPAAAHYQTDLARFARHYHMGALAELAWWRLLAIHNGCTINFAPTESVAAELRAGGMHSVQVVGRGVDTVMFHPRQRDPELRARITGGEDRPILAYVGRVAPEKGLDVLLALADALPECALLVVGDGPARPALEAKLAGRRAYFTGLLHGDKLAAAYASADAFVFPSQTETFGQVVREAMASGLPVVGFKAGGSQDLIGHEVTGVLAQAGDTAGFVAAAGRLAGDAGLRDAMGRAARQEAEAHTWEAEFDQLLRWYREVTDPVSVAQAANRLAPSRRSFS